MKKKVRRAIFQAPKPVTVQEAVAAILEALVKFDPRPLDFETTEKALALAQFEIKWLALKGGQLK